MFRRINKGEVETFPNELSTKIFSYLSYADIHSVMLTCQNSFSADDTFWIKKLKFEFNISNLTKDYKEFFIHLYTEKKSIKESAFLMYLLNRYNKQIENIDVYYELSKNKDNVSLILNSLKEDHDFYTQEKVDFSEAFDKLFSKLLTIELIQRNFFIAHQFISLLCNNESILLNQLQQILVTPFTDESERLFYQLCDNAFVNRYISFAIPIEFLSEKRKKHALETNTPICTSEEANKIFINEIESTILHAIIISVVQLNAIETFKLILNKQPALLHCGLTSLHCSLLHLACSVNSYDIAKLLLENKATINLNFPIEIKRDHETQQFKINPIYYPSILQCALFSSSATQDVAKTKKLVDLLLHNKVDPDQIYYDTLYGKITTRKYCQKLLNSNLLGIEKNSPFYELLSDIINFYPSSLNHEIPRPEPLSSIKKLT